MLGPRQTISWDEYFMRIASVVAHKSKDPNTNVGAVVVDNRNCIVGVGFNGPPPNIPDDQIPWDREGSSELDRKYCWISHAESNALDFSDRNRLAGAKIYVLLFPCCDCSKRIIQAQISEVIYLNDKYHDTDSCVAARKMFDWAGIKYRQYQPSQSEFVVRFNNDVRFDV
jgi:dCMP deaminase